MWCGVFGTVWEYFVVCFVGYVCVLCRWGLKRLNVYVLCCCGLVSVCFGVGGVLCPLVWCGVLVLLWEWFVVVCAFWVFGCLGGLSA